MSRMDAAVFVGASLGVFVLVCGSFEFSDWLWKRKMARAEALIVHLMVQSARLQVSYGFRFHPYHIEHTKVYLANIEGTDPCHPLRACLNELLVLQTIYSVGDKHD